MRTKLSWILPFLFKADILVFLHSCFQGTMLPYFEIAFSHFAPIQIKSLIWLTQYSLVLQANDIILKNSF